MQQLPLPAAVGQIYHAVGPGPLLAALDISSSSCLYRSVAADDSALRLQIREITEIRVHYGCRRVHVMLKREGWRDNHKRIYRLYRGQGLSLRLNAPAAINLR
ncbi:MAG: transposase [Pantoea sp. Pent]|nr:transposase [Pantoea sp. Pent]